MNEFVLALKEFYLSFVRDQLRYMRLERRRLEGHQNRDHNNQPCQEIPYRKSFQDN
jgi:hypothetical protein